MARECAGVNSMIPQGVPAVTAGVTSLFLDVPHDRALGVEPPRRNVEAERVHEQRTGPVVARVDNERYGERVVALHQRASSVELVSVARGGAKGRAEGERREGARGQRFW